MKIIINILILTLLTSCASPVKNYSKISDKIEKKQVILQQKAKILISAGQKLIENGKSKEGLDAIKKGEELLDVTVEDGSEIINSKNIEEEVKKTFDEGKEVKQDINELEEKKSDEVNKMAYNQIGNDAVDKYKFWLGMKLYGILLTIITAIGIYFYFKPTAFISGAFKRITSFFSK
jgi:hypothetical protein